jgi:hypothetical protein
MSSFIRTTQNGCFGQGLRLGSRGGTSGGLKNSGESRASSRRIEQVVRRPPVAVFPWVWKASEVLGVRAVSIDIDHTPGRGWFRTGGHVNVRIRAPLEDEAKVTCVIPGHDRSGREVHADLIKVEDCELSFEFSDRCGYESDFLYSSTDLSE